MEMVSEGKCYYETECVRDSSEKPADRCSDNGIGRGFVTDSLC